MGISFHDLRLVWNAWHGGAAPARTTDTKPPAATRSGRIESLDGLRAIAILPVIGYHYFARWTPPLSQTSLYPYDGVFSGWWLFRYGYLGVDLFFLVSGFVISLTLTKCVSWREFALRRFARLFPAMLLAASLTFFVVRAMPQRFWEVQACGFLPSLTFVDPAIYRKLFGLDCGFHDGAYWSLWVEVRFYVWAAAIFFVGAQASFLRNAGVVMNVALVTLLVSLTAPHVPGLSLADIILFPTHAPWLFSGVAFFFIRSNPRHPGAWILVAEGLLANIGRSLKVVGGREWLVILGIYALFAAFALRLRILDALGSWSLRRIGEASYSLYLIHQRVGVTLIAALATLLGTSGAASVSIAVAVTACLVVIATAIYDWYEVPARRWVTKLGHSLSGAAMKRKPSAATER